jgi:hypothetical protein
MKTLSELAALTVKAALLSIVPNVSLAVAATSDDLFDRYFANVLDGAPCFARTYDDAQLKDHPTRQVRAIQISLSKANSDGTPNLPDRFQLAFALMLTSAPDWVGQTAKCKTNDANFECYLDGDGGMFSLTPQANGGLRLETGDEGIALDSSDKEIELSGKEPDDRIFDLVPSKAECQAASAYFEGGND